MIDLNSPNLRFTATTMAGLEEVLASEIRTLGGRDILAMNRAVGFSGDLGFLYKANFCLRTALRILAPIATFEVKNTDDLYERIGKLSWEKLISPKETIAVDSVISSPLFTHSLFVSQKVKDAITDRFRELTGVRPSVDLADPDLRINVHIAGKNCTVSLDSTGESLHKRGYREATNIAPLNEVLAAGMVMLSGWDRKSAFVDPMCGSGTIVIEAALYAANIPPGYFRLGGIEKQKEPYACFRWKGHNRELWEKIHESCINRINNNSPFLLAADASENVLKKARRNFRSAKVDEMIRSVISSFDQLKKPQGGGVLIMNPPYGERMDKDDLLALYESIGDAMKKNWAGFSCWILTSNLEAAKKIGLKHTRRITLYNGPLECKFLKFEIYEGSRKRSA